MLKFIKLSVLIIFSLLFVSCSNLYQDESDIIIDVGQSISRAVYYARTNSSEKEEFNNAINKALEFEIDFTAGVSGDYITEINRTYSYGYMEIDNINPEDFNAITIPNIPVGSNVTVYVEIEAGEKLRIKKPL